jgi:hypothetical protein
MPAVQTAATSCGSSGFGVGLLPAVPAAVVLPRTVRTCWSVEFGFVRNPTVSELTSGRMAELPTTLAAVAGPVPEALRPWTL